MQRRHAENPPARQLVRSHLQHHRQRFDHEYPAHDEQHDFLPHDHRNGAERGADRERADVPHEYFRRIGVEPQEGEPGAGQRAADYRELAGAGYVGKAQILGEHRVPGDVSEDTECTADHDRRHDRETVEAVGQIHRVAGADDHEVGHDDEAERAERIGDVLEERHDEFGLCRQVGVESDDKRGDDADQRLPRELGSCRQPLRIAPHHFAVVIDPAHGTEAERHHQHHPHGAVLEVSPQQRRHHNRDQDQCAAHGRRAGFGQMRLRAVVAHGLADLVRGQPAYHHRPDRERDEQRRQARQHRAQRDVAEHVERADVFRQPLREL